MIHFHSKINYSFVSTDSPSDNADKEHGSNEHTEKTKVKSVKDLKPYSWTYLDPSIVYRALTSPVLKLKYNRIH